MSKYYTMNINISRIYAANITDHIWAGVSAAIYAHIKALTMLFSHSKLMMSNEDRGVNSCTYRRFLSRIRVN